jgi:hypothetical protein
MTPARKPPPRKIPRKKRFRRIAEYPRHMLEGHVCSPKLGTCESVNVVLDRVEEAFVAQYEALDPSLPHRRRIIDAMTLVFHRVYGDGRIWYPRDRWRTAWSLTIRAAKRADSITSEQVSAFYENVRYLRNPSSEQEAVK